eukprot:TRINITY_DN2142_c0_g1_i1.p1 TRINITY_DN2142_c0_g1~~TRINITY_DN2142_c0_g1_i1.p1  ORF type:complete len:563 (-),score=66.48 TRINITY_DN2142_c0_g1_i1:8-1696(-)
MGVQTLWKIIGTALGVVLLMQCVLYVGFDLATQRTSTNPSFLPFIPSLWSSSDDSTDGSGISRESGAIGSVRGGSVRSTRRGEGKPKAPVVGSGVNDMRNYREAPASLKDYTHTPDDSDDLYSAHKDKERSNKLIVGTYNIWNYNPYWDLRLQRITEVIKDSDPDILALQEVRNIASLGGHQLDAILAKLGVEYRYHTFWSALLQEREIARQQHDLQQQQEAIDWGIGQDEAERNAAVAGKPFVRSEYYPKMFVPPKSEITEEEGIAIISKHPIHNIQRFTFTRKPNDEDRNLRTMILAEIEVPKLGMVYVFATHLSYHNFTQCRHMVELISQIDTLSLDRNTPIILLGDFNTYATFEYPMNFLTTPYYLVASSNLCFGQMQRENIDFEPDETTSISGGFVDVWKMTESRRVSKGHSPRFGYTFSNLPFTESTHTWPSIPCRPDRILLSKNHVQRLRPCRTDVIEDGSEYRRHYYWPLMRKRLLSWQFNAEQVGWGTSCVIGALIGIGAWTLVARPWLRWAVPFVWAPIVLIVFRNVFFTDYIDDLVSSDHRFVLATFEIRS